MFFPDNLHYGLNFVPQPKLIKSITAVSKSALKLVKCGCKILYTTMNIACKSLGILHNYICLYTRKKLPLSRQFRPTNVAMCVFF